MRVWSCSQVAVVTPCRWTYTLMMFCGSIMATITRVSRQTYVVDVLNLDIDVQIEGQAHLHCRLCLLLECLRWKRHREAALQLEIPLERLHFEEHVGVRILPPHSQDLDILSGVVPALLRVHSRILPDQVLVARVAAALQIAGDGEQSGREGDGGGHLGPRPASEEEEIFLHRDCICK